MDKLFTRGVGGFPLVLDDLRQFFGRLDDPSEGIYQAFNNLLRGFGDNFIVQGVVASGTTPNVAITEGWVLLNGELIKVDAQTGIDTATDNKFVKVTTFNSRGTKTFLNGSIIETYEINRAVVQGTSGNLDFDGIRMEASETRQGIVELATDTQAKAGTDSTRAITPKSLHAHIKVIKEFTEARDNVVITTVGQDIHTLTPSTTLGSAKMTYSFQATIIAPTGDGLTVATTTFELKVGVVTKKTAQYTTVNNTARHIVSMQWVGPYVANQEVRITGIQSANIVSIFDSILITEALDAS